MNKNELYNSVNELRSRKSEPPLTIEEFIATLSSLEAKGAIETSIDECWVKGSRDGEMLSGG